MKAGESECKPDSKGTRREMEERKSRQLEHALGFERQGEEGR